LLAFVVLTSPLRNATVIAVLGLGHLKTREGAGRLAGKGLGIGQLATGLVYERQDLSVGHALSPLEEMCADGKTHS
jgi:hypothetical protein